MHDASDDEAQAMKAVVEDMGRAARAAKAAKYAPKRAEPAPEAPPAEETAGAPSLADLEALLGANGG